MVGLQAAGAQASPAQEGQSGPAAERPHNGTSIPSCRPRPLRPTRSRQPSTRRPAPARHLRRLLPPPRPLAGPSAARCRAPRPSRHGRGASCAPPGPSATRRAYEESFSASARAGVAACMPASPVPRPIRSIAHPIRRAWTSMPIRRPALHAARLRLEERTAVSYSTAVTPLGYSKDIATPRRATSSPRARSAGTASTCARRCRRSSTPSLRALPLPAQLHRQAAARPLPGEDFARQHQARHHHLRSQRARGRDLQGVAEGRIHYIDTHPDNSLTRGIYGKAFARSSPGMGAGFKRWRPQTLVGGLQAADGSWHGGQIQLTADKDIPDWSDEQFFGTEQGAAEAVERRQVRARERNPRILRLRAQTARERRLQVRPAGGDALDRARAVRGPEVSRRRGGRRRQGRHPQAAQPDRLPNNIYGTDGDWETYSTPSRDARLEDGLQGAARRGRPVPVAGGRRQRPPRLRGRGYPRRYPPSLPAGSERVHDRLHARRRQRQAAVVC